MDFYAAVLKSGSQSNTLIRVSFFDQYNRLMPVNWNNDNFNLLKNIFKTYVQKSGGWYVRDDVFFLKSFFRFSNEFSSAKFSVFLKDFTEELIDLKSLNFYASKVRFEFCDVPDNAAFLDIGYLDVQVNSKAHIVSKNERNTFMLDEFYERFDFGITAPDLRLCDDAKDAINAYSGYAKRMVEHGFAFIQNDQLQDILRGQNYYLNTLLNSEDVSLLNL